MKYLFLLLGFLSFALGALGVVLPILPTTPFLLVSAFCFARSSQRFYQWLIYTMLYKKHLKPLVTTGQMPLQSKLAILFLVTALLLLAFIMIHNLPGRIAIVVLLCIKWYVFLFRIGTTPKQT